MKCCKLECAKAATKMPVLTFAAKVAPHGVRAEGELLMPLCDEHAVPDVDEFVTDQAWAQICAGVRSAGKAEPDRNTLRVKFRPIQ